MIALDNSSLQVQTAIASGEVVLPPAVMSEALSDPKMLPENEERLMTFPIMPTQPEFWIRAGKLRRFLRILGFHSKLPDVLIAQACIDANVPLITYDPHFRRFEFAGLQLA